MQIITVFLLTVATLAAAAYAHYRVPFHTSSQRDRWFVHVLLVAIGITFGWVSSQRYPVSGLLEVLVFLSSFGVVHIPAAGILFIKHQQKEKQLL